jgi:hypothetical protein
MSGAKRWLASSGSLGCALGWRVRREGLRYLAAIFVPFTVLLILITTVSLTTGGRGLKGAGGFAAFGTRYGGGADAIMAGLLLLMIPGLVALFSAIGVTRTVQGLVGSEVSRGGLEALLAAPYTVGAIAAALLGYALTVATAFALAMSGLGSADVAAASWVTGVHLSLPGSYLAGALLLPVLSAWSGAALALLISLLFPRLTQLGATVNVAGGSLGTGLAVLPGLGALLMLLLAAPSLGILRVLLIAGGATALITIAAVAVVAWKFEPEAVLES